MYCEQGRILICCCKHLSTCANRDIWRTLVLITKPAGIKLLVENIQMLVHVTSCGPFRPWHLLDCRRISRHARRQPGGGSSPCCWQLCESLRWAESTGHMSYGAVCGNVDARLHRWAASALLAHCLIKSLLRGAIHSLFPLLLFLA